ncbi:MAG TPA: TrmH family RNA methyltransferase, partial [Micropepsaceae bacterium]|nr:TrmH family RNA methyltransferase [Micropepsaceae bacterium]
MRLALVEPDIAPNLGAIIRLGACMGLPIDVIEPCGFPFSLHAVRRSAMDYADHADITRHVSWQSYETHARTMGWRLVMVTPEAPVAYTAFAFSPDDVLVLGSESVGLPAPLR